MKDDIIKWAREAGILPDEDGSHYWISHDSELQCFAALVADAEAKRMHAEGMVTVGYMRQQIAAEREAVARIAEEWQGPTKDREIHIAQAIRARGNT
jgi:hypothetical protein